MGYAGGVRGIEDKMVLVVYKYLDAYFLERNDACTYRNTKDLILNGCLGSTCLV
jgi:hypothetical protein